MWGAVWRGAVWWARRRAQQGCQQGRARQRSRACVSGQGLPAPGAGGRAEHHVRVQRGDVACVRASTGRMGAVHRTRAQGARARVHVSRVCAHLRPRRELATLRPEQHVLEVELRVLLDAQRVRQAARREARHAQHATGDRVAQRKPTQERSHQPEIAP